MQLYELHSLNKFTLEVGHFEHVTRREPLPFYLSHVTTWIHFLQLKIGDTRDLGIKGSQSIKIINNTDTYISCLFVNVTVGSPQTDEKTIRTLISFSYDSELFITWTLRYAALLPDTEQCLLSSKHPRVPPDGALGPERITT